MNKRLHSTALQLLVGLCLACSPAQSCPSVDSWLEFIRLGDGEHAYLNAADLERRLDMLGQTTDAQWTGGIAAIMPDGERLLLLVLNTGVCGVVRFPAGEEPKFEPLHGTEDRS
jgi:hypothetical protein